MKDLTFTEDASQYTHYVSMYIQFLWPILFIKKKFPNKSQESRYNQAFWYTCVFNEIFWYVIQ